MRRRYATLVYGPAPSGRLAYVALNQEQLKMVLAQYPHAVTRKGWVEVLDAEVREPVARKECETISERSKETEDAGQGTS